MNIKTNPEINTIFDNYPVFVRDKMRLLRRLVIETAEEMPEIAEIEETLKWGEPSFITKIGSTLRMDWKEKNHDKFALYFQCSSRLVETFRLVYEHTFNYEGKRAIVFQLDQDIPVIELKECIKAALRYHKVKHLEFLGMK